MKSLRSICQLLKDSKRISVIVHHHPDGDAIGSAVALKEALAPSREVSIISSSPIPSVFIAITGPVATESVLPNDSDLYVIVDCGELHRTGFSRQIQKLSKCGKKILAVDHHQSGDMQRYCSDYFGDPTACATAQLIFELLNVMRLPISRTAATALLMGVYTDTGGFRHQTTSAATLQLSSRLVRYGAELTKISQAFYRDLPPERKKLWGLILSQITMKRFGVVVASVPKELLHKSGATVDDISGLANLLSLTLEARVALVLVETESGWRGVLRSRYPSINLGRLARLLGGSGHKKAAGFMATSKQFSGKIKHS